MTDQTQFTNTIPGVRDMRVHQGLSGTQGSSSSSNMGPSGVQGAEMNKPLKATLTGFEGNYALLHLTDSDEVIKWPKVKVPAEAQIGDGLLLEAVSVSTLKEEELKRMRMLLEELIN